MSSQIARMDTINHRKLYGVKKKIPKKKKK